MKNDPENDTPRSAVEPRSAEAEGVRLCECAARTLQLISASIGLMNRGEFQQTVLRWWNTVRPELEKPGAPCPCAGMRAENAKLKAEAVDLRMAAIPTRRRSDAAWETRLAASQERERVLREALQPFANWYGVLRAILERDRQNGIERERATGWEDVDPILGALGQLVTRGDFRRAAEALAVAPDGVRAALAEEE